MRRVLSNLITIKERIKYYDLLCKSYTAEGAPEKWIPLVQKMMKLPRQNLTSAHWEVYLAYHHARNDDEENSLRNACHAAGCYSGYALYGLFNIQTKFESYDEAYNTFKLLAERYPSESSVIACLFTEKIAAKSFSPCRFHKGRPGVRGAD